MPKTYNYAVTYNHASADGNLHIIGHLASTEKIIVSMEKCMLPRKMLNIIVFCKAQHNTGHMFKKSPNLSLYMLTNVMLIKKTCMCQKNVVKTSMLIYY